MVLKALGTDDETMNRLHVWRREDGQTMAEYSVILAVITPAIVLAIALMSNSIASVIGEIADLLS
jgi:Flp pilus assembly pilin Flp